MAKTYLAGDHLRVNSATGASTLMRVNVCSRSGASVNHLTEASAANLLQPGIPQALGTWSGSTAHWTAGGSALLLVTGAVSVPQEVHLAVADASVYAIGSTAGSTYSGSTPAFYVKDQTHRIPVRGMTYLHVRAKTSGQTANVSATVFWR